MPKEISDCLYFAANNDAVCLEFERMIPYKHA